MSNSHHCIVDRNCKLFHFPQISFQLNFIFNCFLLKIRKFLLFLTQLCSVSFTILQMFASNFVETSAKDVNNFFSLTLTVFSILKFGKMQKKRQKCKKKYEKGGEYKKNILTYTVTLFVHSSLYTGLFALYKTVCSIVCSSIFSIVIIGTVYLIFFQIYKILKIFLKQKFYIVFKHSAFFYSCPFLTFPVLTIFKI